MMRISNLPKDLLEEILCRVPFKYLREVRSTCKKWYDLSKTRSFADKHIEKAAVSGEKQFLMISEFGVDLIGVNLHGSQNNNVDLSIKRKGKLISRYSSDKFHRSQVVHHCKGIFLCVWGNILMLWNPYWGNSKWVVTRNPSGRFQSDMYALGYNKSTGSHKILRLFGKNLDMYDLSSNSWMIPDGTLEQDIDYKNHGVSLKGDTYWYARDKYSIDCYLLCFDFTRERFGPRLSLPLVDDEEGWVSFSAVREEKLALLVRRWDTLETEFWVTNKIEPDAVSWNIFFKVNMETSLHAGIFLIDEEKKLAVVFDEDQGERFETIYKNAYITGDNGYFKRVDLRKSPYAPFYNLVCSYVPSSAQIKY